MIPECGNVIVSFRIVRESMVTCKSYEYIYIYHVNMLKNVISTENDDMAFINTYKSIKSFTKLKYLNT